MNGVFVDMDDGAAAPAREFWEPVIFSGAQIREEVERLRAQPGRDPIRRESIFAHPRSSAPGLGLAPGIRVTLSVVLPGERTPIRRDNCTRIVFCIDGVAIAETAEQQVCLNRYDVWNV